MVNTRAFWVWEQRTASALFLCLLAVSPWRAMDASIALHLVTTKSSAEASPQNIKHIAEYPAILGTVITLLSGAMSVLPTLAESISLTARRKRAPDRGEALAKLMAKIRTDDALTENLRSNVGVQIEAEITEALNGLNDNRLKRRRALASSSVGEHDDLTAYRRAFLWHAPHGFWAWIAHLLALSVPAAGRLLLLIDAAVADTLASNLPFIGKILACVIIWWLPFRAWALHQRRTWQTSHPLPKPAAQEMSQEVRAAARPGASDRRAIIQPLASGAGLGNGQVHLSRAALASHGTQERSHKNGVRSTYRQAK